MESDSPKNNKFFQHTKIIFSLEREVQLFEKYWVIIIPFHCSSKLAASQGYSVA